MTWRGIEAAVPLPFRVLTTTWLPEGTALAAGPGGVYRIRGVPTGVAGDDQDAALRLAGAQLGLPQPVPANPWVEIPLTAVEPGVVRLAVDDLRGALVRDLVAGRLSTGGHRVTWDGRDEAGHEMPSGVYFVELDASGVKETQGPAGEIDACSGRPR